MLPYKVRTTQKEHPKKKSGECSAKTDMRAALFNDHPETQREGSEDPSRHCIYFVICALS